MGEIKSTLDLVLERTKHLKMSEQEKIQQRRQEMLMSVRALLQRCEERILPLAEAEAALQELQRDAGGDVRRTVVEEALARLKPEADNRPLLDLLREALGLDVAPLEILLAEFAAQRERQRGRLARELESKLRIEGRIYGTAVVPNPVGDDRWKAFLARQGKRLDQRMAEQAQRMMDADGGRRIS